MFRYFGSKRRLARTYQAPRHDIIIEPFAGAAAYAMHWLSERPSLSAILVEKDPDVAALWHRILSMTPDDILAIPTPTPGDQTTDLLVALTAGAASPLGAVKNQGYATVTQWQARDFPSVRKRMAQTRGHVGDGRITVIHGDYSDAPDVEGTWFIDPPYQHQGHLYAMGSDGLDYQQLSDWCQNRKGQTIVCEAAPADWLPFAVHQSAMTQERTRVVELVWESDPIPTLF